MTSSFDLTHQFTFLFLDTKSEHVAELHSLNGLNRRSCNLVWSHNWTVLDCNLLDFSLWEKDKSTMTYQISDNMELDRSADMLSCAMMLVSISEESPLHIGCNTTFNQCRSGRTFSASWGTLESRKSYKTDLSTLSSASTNTSPTASNFAAHATSSNDVDEWGFFMDED